MVHAVVFYHASCNDGFGAAWAAWKHFGETALYQPMKYGDPVPDWAQALPLSTRFYILDFSFPRAMLEAWMQDGRTFTLLDHHKTALDELRGLDASRVAAMGSKLLFDLHHSGAVLAWRYFHPSMAVPILLEYVQDRDLWKKALPQTDEHHAGLLSHERSFSVWEFLAGEGWPSLIEDGTALLRYQRQQVSEMCAHMVWRTIGGHRVPVVNATANGSEVGHHLVTEYSATAPFAAYYFDRADGKRQWGLRAAHGFDCSVIAQQYGGGGHPGASGFVTELGWLGDGA